MKNKLTKLKILLYFFIEAYENWKSEVWERDLDEEYWCGATVRECFDREYNGINDE